VLWDIIGKSVNLPLAKLFGGMSDRVDTYASSGLWLSDSIEHLVGEVRRALDTSIASGETSYTRFGMQAILDARAVDVLMPDLQRIGGFSEMRRSCALASTHNIGVSPHFIHRIQPVDRREHPELHLDRAHRLVSTAVQRTARTRQRSAGDPRSTGHRLHISTMNAPIWQGFPADSGRG